MKIKQRLYALAVACSAAILVLDSKTALKGCAEGIALCLHNAIPALFPFLVLSPMLISCMQFRLPKALCRLIKLPKGADALVIAGCLGGYPVGAQCIAAAAQNKGISKSEARRLMAFCCNCGPGFVFGLCGGYFSWKWAAWWLWLSHLAGAFMVGWLIPRVYSNSCSPSYTQTNITQSLTRAVKTMAQICGWVILFRCILEYLQKWVFLRLSSVVTVLLTGALELTNGCLALAKIVAPGLRFIVCEAMLSLGGLCVAMQTASVTTHITMGLYIPGKLAQTLLSSMIAAIIWTLHTKSWPLAAIEAIAFLSILAAAKAIVIKKENYSRNIMPLGV